MPRNEESVPGATAPLVILYLAELSLAVTWFGFYKASALHATNISRYGIVGFAAAALSIALAVLLIVYYTRDRRAVTVALMVNAISVALTLGVAELSLRLLAHPGEGGVAVGKIPLRPTWSEIRRRSAAVVRNATFFVNDPLLGWTIGSNRTGGGGLYFSSVEGIRSQQTGVEYRRLSPRPSVALIGDSNAFSMEVSFRESLGYYLDRLLGPGDDVLNFGVDGYGIDQIFLHYLRDVRPWKPTVVVIVFIQHDLIRTMAVYPFISFGWPGYLVKPRFDFIDERLKLINLPLPSPQSILATSTVRKLPHIDYDPGYTHTDWQWRFDHGPMLLRLLTTVSPPWPDAPAKGTASTSTLNAVLFRALIASIKHDGAEPILVYLPGGSIDDTLVRRVLDASHIEYLSMEHCLAKVPADRLRVPSGGHYTGFANHAIAECVAPAVQQELLTQGAAH